jgi:hypothetical protein
MGQFLAYDSLLYMLLRRSPDSLELKPFDELDNFGRLLHAQIMICALDNAWATTIYIL